MRPWLLLAGLLLLGPCLAGCGKGSAAATMRVWTPVKKELPQPVDLRSGETAKPADIATKPATKMEAPKAEPRDKKIAPPKAVAIQPPSPTPSPILQAQSSPTDQGAASKQAIERKRPVGREFTSRNSIKFKAASSLPDGLPSWFKERDKDEDGQLGIYEWPEEDMAEFSKYDRNGDGFATGFEVLRVTNPSALAKASASAEPKTETTTSSADSSATGLKSNSGSGSTSSSSGGWGSLLSSFSRSGGSSSTSSSSTASSESDRTQSYFKSMDKNGDGKMSKDESFYFRTRFDDMDTNKDGGVDLEEFTKYRQNRDRDSSRGRRGSFGFGF